MTSKMANIVILNQVLLPYDMLTGNAYQCMAMDCQMGVSVMHCNYVNYVNYAMMIAMPRAWQ